MGNRFGLNNFPEVVDFSKIFDVMTLDILVKNSETAPH